MDCVCKTGFLFWRKPCGRPAIGACDDCRLFICQMHGNIRGDGGLTCNACDAAENDSDSGSWFTFGSSSSSSDSSSWSSDSSSSSSDSGSSDSGGSSDSSSSSSD